MAEYLAARRGAARRGSINARTDAASHIFTRAESRVSFLFFPVSFFFYLSSPALRNCSLMPARVRRRREYTDWSFLSPPPRFPGRVPRERKKKKEKKVTWGGEGREEGNYGRKARCGSASLAHVCAYVKPEADTGRDGRSDGWTDEWGDGHGGVKAGMHGEREEGARRGRTEGCESLGRCDGTTAHKSSA